MSFSASITEVWTGVSDGDCWTCDGADMVWKVSADLYIGGTLVNSNSGCTTKGSGPSRNTWLGVNPNEGVISWNTAFPFFNLPNDIDLCNTTENRVDFVFEAWENDCSSACTYNSSCSSWGGGDDHYSSSGTVTIALADMFQAPSTNATITRSWNNGNYRVRLNTSYTIDNDEGSALVARNASNVVTSTFCQGETFTLTLDNYDNFDDAYVVWEKRNNSSSSWGPAGDGRDLYTLTQTATTNGMQYRARSEDITSGGARCIGEEGGYQTITINVNTNPVRNNDLSLNNNKACAGSADGELILNHSDAKASSTYDLFLRRIVGNNDNVISFVTISGSEFPYIVTGVEAGTYYFVVAEEFDGSPTDCSATSPTTTVTEVALPEITDIEIIRNVTCRGDSDGRFRVFTNSATAQVLLFDSGNNLIQTQNRVAGGNSFPGLSGGNYTVEARNSIGCAVTDNSITIGESTTDLTIQTSLSTGVDPTYNIDCNGGTGTVFVTGQGGTPPYTLFVGFGSDVLGVGEGQTIAFENRPAGTYNAWVTDAFNCSVMQVVTLTEPPTAVSMVIDSILPTTSCADVGLVQVTASGGTGPYTYSLGQTTNSTGTFADLAVGSYTIIATDIWGCTGTIAAEVTAPGAIMLSFVETEVSCADTMNGAIQVTIAGGVPEFDIELLNSSGTIVATHMTSGNTSHTFTNLSGDVYTIRVTDSQGCNATSNFEVFEPDPLEIIGVDIVQRPCDDDDSVINIELKGRASGFLDELEYTVSFDGGPFSSNAREVDGQDNGVTELIEVFSNFPATASTLSLMDDRGCVAINSPFDIEDITQPDPITMTFISSTEPSCFDGQDGTITMQINGGRPPYEARIWSWLGTATGEMIDYTVIVENDGDQVTFIGLPASGEGAGGAGYDFDILDGLGGADEERCRYFWFNEGANINQPVAVSQPDLLEITNVVYSGPAEGLNCTQDNGALTVTVTGGTTPYEYSSNNADFQTGNELMNLGPLPTVYVRDARGCLDSFEVTTSLPIAPIPIELLSVNEIQAASECSPAIDEVVLGGITEPMNVVLIDVTYIEVSVFDEVNPFVDIDVSGSNFIVTNSFLDYDDYEEGEVFFLEFEVSDTAGCVIYRPGRAHQQLELVALHRGLGGDYHLGAGVEILPRLFQHIREDRHLITAGGIR
ncbi:MAG: hypothetical protein AAF544_07370, partial [Bacteroidota bacterium]